MSDSNVSPARARIESRIEAIGRLRGGGPNPFDFNQWDDRTREVLTALFGDDSPELARYLEAAGVRGRLVGVRGQAANMTLNIHGPWGILVRLDRAEAVLSEIAAGL
ncbi:MAG: hypothetical protein ACE5EF_09350 [Dehalococcoidia bacterium]